MRQAPTGARISLIRPKWGESRLSPGQVLKQCGRRPFVSNVLLSLSHVLFAVVGLIVGVALFIVLRESNKASEPKEFSIKRRPDPTEEDSEAQDGAAEDSEATEGLEDSELNLTEDGEVPFEDSFAEDDSTIGRTAAVLDKLADLSLSKTDYRRTVQSGLVTPASDKPPPEQDEPKAFVPLKKA